MNGLPPSVLLLVAAAASCGEAGPPPTAAMEPRVEHREVELSGSSVHVATAGPPGGAAILFLHGRAFDAGTWVELGTLEAAAARGLLAVAVDLPGFGRSPEGGPPRDDFVVALLDALGLERALLVSPSMSGRWAIPAITRHPDRFTGWVAVAPVGIDEHEDDLAVLDLDTLAIWGSEDAGLPVSVGEHLRDLVPDARLEVLPGASHPCYLDAPARFHELVFAFAER